MIYDSNWLMLVLTLPQEGGSIRVRVWRALKSLGCGVLRDGVYLLPDRAEQAQALKAQADDIASVGGTAHLVQLRSADEQQHEAFRALFDRSVPGNELLQSLEAARKSLSTSAAAEISRQQRRLRREVEALRAIDFFPGEVSARVALAWDEFVATAAAVLSPDEPQTRVGSIARLDPSMYRRRRWATRRQMWVDRVASAWLIRRFIDPEASFIWLVQAGDCPDEALGFDFDGARFSHVGDQVTFQVLAASFGLDADAGIVRMGALVRTLDIGGAIVPEAAGFEAILAGARERGLDDDRLLDEIGTVLDSLYAHFAQAAREHSP